MRIHDKGPRAKPRDPHARKVHWGHDYGTRGVEDRHELGREIDSNLDAIVPAEVGFYRRAWSRLRSLVR